jgi:hypothetical protein
MKADAILQGQQLMEKVVAAPYVVHYATALVRATRSGRAGSAEFVKDLVQWGAGPRASQFLIRGAKALAAMDGRLHIATQDIRDVALPVLRHRIATSFQAQSEGVDAAALVKRLIEAVPEPKVEAFAKKSASRGSRRRKHERNAAAAPCLCVSQAVFPEGSGGVAMAGLAEKYLRRDDPGRCRSQGAVHRRGFFSGSTRARFRASASSFPSTASTSPATTSG